jgi:protein translocase SecG subunit
MNVFLSVLQIVISLLVVGLVLLQPPANDSASASIAAPTITRRGWDKFMFTITILAAIIFVVFSFFRMIAPDVL